jgi:hypothetical protein
LDSMFARAAEPSSCPAALPVAEPLQQQAGEARPQPAAAASIAAPSSQVPTTPKVTPKQQPPIKPADEPAKPGQSSNPSNGITIAKLENPPCEVILHSVRADSGEAHTLSIKSLADSNRKLPKGTKVKAYTAGRFIRPNRTVAKDTAAHAH